MKRVNCKVLFPYVGLIFFMVITGVYFYNNVVNKVANETGGVYFSRDINPERTLALTDRELVQEFTTTRDHLGKIGLGFQKRGNVGDTEIHVRLREKETGEFVQEWTIPAAQLGEEEKFYFFSLDHLLVGKNKVMELVISARGEWEPGSLSVYCSKNFEDYGNLYNGGKEEKVDLALALAGPVQYLTELFWALNVVFIVVVCLLYWLVSRKKRLPLEKIFLIAGGFLGVVYLFLFTPYSEPDSRAHLATVFYYTDILTGQEPVDAEGKTMVRREDLEADGLHEFLGLDNYNTLKENLFTTSEDNTMVPYTRGKMATPFAAHLPQIAGTWLGIVLGMGGTATLLLGKAFALFFYLLCCYIAIKIIPFGKMILFFCALLPFSLETGTSYSYDGTVLALAILMTGYALYLKERKKQVGLKEVLFWVFLTIWIAPCKIVYYFLTFLILLVPAEKFKSKKKYYGAAVAGGLSGVASLALNRMATISQAVTGQGEEHFSIQMFFEDIPEALMMIGRTIDYHLEDYLKQIFGSLYSWQDVHLTWSFVIAYVILFCGVLLCRQTEKQMLVKKDKVWLFLICFLVSAAIAASLLFTWTPTDAKVIVGIQGRYFLPILPLIALLFRNKVITLQKDIDGQLVLCTMLVQFLTVSQLFTAIIKR